MQIHIQSSAEFIAVVNRKGKHSERQFFWTINKLRKKKKKK